MSHSILALIWQSWRLSRRWYLTALAASFYLGWVTFNLDKSAFVKERVYLLRQANDVCIDIFAIACISTLLTISVGNKNCFPFSFEYRLPVSTFTLVTVPMLFLGFLCASLYIIPLGLYGLMLDIPFPLLPGSFLIFNMVIVILCSTWSTTSYKSRSVAVTFSVFLLILLFIWFEPLDIFSDYRRTGRPYISDIISLDGREYLLLVFVSVILQSVTVLLVSRLRRGEHVRPHLWTNTVGRVSIPLTGRREKVFSISTVVGRLADKLAFTCPTTRPWHAETWHEFKRYGLPVLVLSFTFAMLIPLVTLFGAMINWSVALDITNSSPLIIYFTGIGMSLFNRRQIHGGYMNVFEGSRAMPTLQLASIQILTVAIVTAIGIVLIMISLVLSQPLASSLRPPNINLISLLVLTPDTNYLMVLNNLVIGVFVYINLISIFFCFHSCAVFWGRKFLLITAMLAFNAIMLIASTFQSQEIMLNGRTLQSEELFQTFIILIWIFSISVGLGTLIVLKRIHQLQVASLRTGFIFLFGWLVFVVCGYFNMKYSNYDFSNMNSEFLALNAVMLLLPLTITLLTLWCYDRLRHT